MAERNVIHLPVSREPLDPTVGARFNEAQRLLREINRIANHILAGGDDPEHRLSHSMGSLTSHLHYLQSARRRLN